MWFLFLSLCLGSMVLCDCGRVHIPTPPVQLPTPSTAPALPEFWYPCFHALGL